MMNPRSRHVLRSTEGFAFGLLITTAACGAWLRHHDAPWIRVYHAIAYTDICRRFNADDSCATKRIPGPKQEFTIVPVEQKVIQRIDGREIRLQDCSVRSRRDWECTAQNAEHRTFKLLRVNGDFDTTEVPTVTAYTSYSQWRLIGGRD